MWYSQKDNRWSNTRIGSSSETFHNAGCLITSLANLDTYLHNSIGRTPLQIMNILLVDGAINSDGMLDLNAGAKALNMSYNKLYEKPDMVCIAETNAYANVAPQHFFVLNPYNSKIIDPLDLNPDWKIKPEKYNIVSYRVLKYGV
jgi:hypothetical protein